MDERLRQELIQQGLQKIEGKLNKTWDEIGLPYSIHGEKVRDMVKKYRKRNGLLKGDKYKILSLSDIHLPVDDYSEILNIINAHKNEVDEIVLNGDIFNADILSTFDKSYWSHIEDELIQCHKLLNEIRKITKVKITFVRGNHEHRLNRFVAKRCLEISSLVNDDLLDLFVGGFTIYDKKNKIKTQYQTIDNVYYSGTFYYKVGKTVFAHPLNFSATDAKTSVKTADYFRCLFGDEVDTVVIGHTHRLTSVLGGSIGLNCYEQGCICEEQSYSTQGNINYKPQNRGYIIVVQDKHGNLLPNETRLYSL